MDMNVACYVTIWFSEGAAAGNIKQAWKREQYTPRRSINRETEEW